MSLDAVTTSGQGKEGEEERNRGAEMVKAAQEFDRLAGMADNKGARDHLNKLDEKTKMYIENHPSYGWRYHLVNHMRG